MNKYAIFGLLLIGAFFAGYLLKDTKVITKVETKVEYIKVEGKTVVVTKPDGSSISTTDFVSNTTASSTAHTKTEINARKTSITGLFSPSGKGNGYGGIVTHNFFGSVGVGGGVIYAPKETRGLVAISLQF
jgi:hypothetical protein